MLTWIFQHHSFWNLACFACGSRHGWNVSQCSWRSLSCVAIVHCRLCGAEQFLKRYYRFGAGIKQMAQSEYEVLQQLNSLAGSPASLRLPRAYRFSATTSAFSMESLKGQSVDQMMRLAQNRQGFDDCLRVSADWLRQLHGLPPLCGKAGKDYTTTLQKLESDCRILADREETVDKALSVMRHGLAEIGSRPINRVLLHGDFKASNLIWTQQGVYGIDVGLRFKNPGAMDISQFIADVLLNRFNIPALESNHDLASILDILLEAYGDNSGQNRKCTLWWLLYFLLSRWQGDLKGWKPSMSVNRNYSMVVEDVISCWSLSEFLHRKPTCS